MLEINKKERFIRDINNSKWYDKKYKKLILWSCESSCWEGKYCSNCFSANEKRKENNGFKEPYYYDKNNSTITAVTANNYG